MAEAKSKRVFAHAIGERVEFKDGRKMRTAVIVAQLAPTDERPQGYTVAFRNIERMENALVFWAEKDMKAAGEQKFAFKKGDKVRVLSHDDVGGNPDLPVQEPQRGTIDDRVGISINALEPQYAVKFIGLHGRPDLAWWSESMLAKDDE
jgi:hypothetical protein